MFLHRCYRRPRWIVGCTVVSTAVITMLLAHSLGVVSVTVLCMFCVANLNVISTWLFFQVGEHCSAKTVLDGKLVVSRLI